ncbi:putative major fimbrial subunit LpfA [Arsenophonus endosymbiont of Aleurodicus floccissimus]|uniref:fimbrial protein n=1 Tax=Arsenophonus endosymbiont of Aleurodicus floccissimus TaxID=2152761 RepID=UPI000E6AEA51|nr:fimbrial protein [Arsenophonus endosymbiont of Aleurodicus floccissimus]SPP31178.1 putative major fimbrial subunit LpfA [Arsenophonus endosymbiont of Aleurodicus floccissimus]
MRNLLMTSFLSIFYLTQFTTHASDGNIKFTGEIIQSSCTFRALTKDQTVSLGTVATNSFKKVHDTASPTVFNIEINNFPNNSQEVFVIFDGVKDEINNELLAIKEGDGYATGVSIGIYNNSERYISLNHKTGVYPINDKIAILKFIAKYVATEDIFLPGKVEANANFTLVYN